MRRLQIIFVTLILSGFSEYTMVAQRTPGKEYQDKPLRIEVPARSVNETYRIIPCGLNCVIMFFRSQEVSDETKTKWYFTCYDTNFQQRWVKSIPLLNDQDYRFHQLGRDTLALLFVHTGKSHSLENDFEVLRIVLNKGTFILNSGKLPDNADVAAFGIQQGRGWIGLNVKGQAGKIMNINLKQEAERSFPLGQGNQLTIQWMQSDSSSETVSAIVSRQISKKNIEYYFVRYDTTGLIRNEIMIGMLPGDHQLTHFQMTSPRPGEEMLMGCYTQGMTNFKQKNNFSDGSTGFFVTPIVNGAQQSISFYNFLELHHVTSLLDERDIMNIKQKALKKNKLLAEYSLDFSILLHDVFSWNDQQILTAEVFSPQYHTESITDFDYYGRPYTNSYSVFDGYRFFNAIVAGFDNKGRLLWDNTMEIRNLVSHELTPNVVTFSAGSNLVLCYDSDGKIGSEIIHENDVVEKLDYTPIDLLYPEDKLLSESKSKLIPWYGNYFLSYGYQEIKNIAVETNNKRLVFYFSKLRFEK